MMNIIQIMFTPSAIAIMPDSPSATTQPLHHAVVLLRRSLSMALVAKSSAPHRSVVVSVLRSLAASASFLPAIPEETDQSLLQHVAQCLLPAPLNAVISTAQMTDAWCKTLATLPDAWRCVAVAALQQRLVASVIKADELLNPVDASPRDTVTYYENVTGPLATEIWSSLMRSLIEMPAPTERHLQALDLVMERLPVNLRDDAAALVEHVRHPAVAACLIKHRIARKEDPVTLLVGGGVPFTPGGGDPDRNPAAPHLTRRGGMEECRAMWRWVCAPAATWSDGERLNPLQRLARVAYAAAAFAHPPPHDRIPPEIVEAWRNPLEVDPFDPDLIRTHRHEPVSQLQQSHMDARRRWSDAMHQRLSIPGPGQRIPGRIFQRAERTDGYWTALPDLDAVIADGILLRWERLLAGLDVRTAAWCADPNVMSAVLKAGSMMTQMAGVGRSENTPRVHARVGMLTAATAVLYAVKTAHAKEKGGAYGGPRPWFSEYSNATGHPLAPGRPLATALTIPMNDWAADPVSWPLLERLAQAYIPVAPDDALARLTQPARAWQAEAAAFVRLRARQRSTLPRSMTLS